MEHADHGGGALELDHFAGEFVDVEFAEVDLLLGVEVAGGVEDVEEGVSVALQLGALLGFQGVFDGEFMEAELNRKGVEFGHGGAVQAIHAIPSRSCRKVSARVAGEVTRRPSR